MNHTGLDGLISLQHALRQCHDCARMCGPPVHGEPVASPVMLVGQAPGTKEIEQGRPFCWTAGKTLFRIEPGRSLLPRALEQIASHPSWRVISRTPAPGAVHD